MFLVLVPPAPSRGQSRGPPPPPPPSRGAPPPPPASGGGATAVCSVADFLPPSPPPPPPSQGGLPPPPPLSGVDPEVQEHYRELLSQWNNREEEEKRDELMKNLHVLTASEELTADEGLILLPV